MPSFISGSRHREGVFQGAHGGFNPGPPAQPAAEPALPLLLGPLGREPSLRRQRHLLHSQGFCLALVFCGKKSAVAGGHLWRLPETRLMLLERRHPRRGIGRIAGENFVTTHDAVFHLINPHQPTKLVGLMRFALADDFCVGARTGSTVCPPRGCSPSPLVPWFAGSRSPPRGESAAAGRSGWLLPGLCPRLSVVPFPSVAPLRWPGARRLEPEPTTSGN